MLGVKIIEGFSFLRLNMSTVTIHVERRNENSINYPPLNFYSLFLRVESRDERFFGDKIFIFTIGYKH